jgi:hypothetical protein
MAGMKARAGGSVGGMAIGSGMIRCMAMKNYAEMWSVKTRG